MLSRPTLVIVFGALSLLGLGACKSPYSDTYSYRKNNFQPPVERKAEIVAPTDVPMPLEGAAPGGVLPGGIEAMPGAPAPAADAIPGLPEAAPPPGAPPAPAIPGLN